MPSAFGWLLYNCFRQNHFPTSILTAVLIPILSLSQTVDQSFWEPFIEADRQALRVARYDTLSFEKAYRIWTDYQVVELIQLRDSSYAGQLVNFVRKINRKGERKKAVYQSLLIPDAVVRRLMEKLYAQQIETLPDGDEVEGYVIGLDGKTYIFEIGLPHQRRVYAYWEPENDHYQDQHIKEVQSVRHILQAINAEFNLKDWFVRFRDMLPRGRYAYGMMIMVRR